MGKGKGKGGCGLLEQIGDCIQCIAATICCLCVSGPILIIIGIVFIASAFSDGRGERIDQFKVAVSNWNDGAVGNWNQLTASDWSYTASNSCGGASQTGPLAKVTTTETARDTTALGSEASETDTFASYTPLLFADNDPGSLGSVSPATGSTSSNCQLTFEISLRGSAVANITVPAQSSTVQRFNDLCTMTQQSSSDRRRRVNIEDEDISQCRRRCQASGGSASGNSYQSFQCVTESKPVAVCTRVKAQGNGYVVAEGMLPEMTSGASGAGCYLQPPGSRWREADMETFTQSGPLAVDVLVRNERDPYLYFLDISKGLKDFGLTRGEKLRIGFTCLGLGIVLTAVICGCCFIIVKYARSFGKGNKPARPANPVGGALYDVSAKYGSFIPGGGTAMGQPVHQGTPVAGQQGGKPGMYDGGKPGYGSPTGPTGAAGRYDGTTSYDTGAPPGYPSPAGGAPGYGNSGGMPYGNSAPYNQQGQYGGNSNAPPPGYPGAAV